MMGWIMDAFVPRAGAICATLQNFSPGPLVNLLTSGLRVSLTFDAATRPFEFARARADAEQDRDFASAVIASLLALSWWRSLFSYLTVDAASCKSRT